jgi:hypothetical protein
VLSFNYKLYINASVDYRGFYQNTKKYNLNKDVLTRTMILADLQDSNLVNKSQNERQLAVSYFLENDNIEHLYSMISDRNELYSIMNVNMIWDTYKSMIIYRPDTYPW